MATTRIIPMHLNKGKTIARCLSDRTDYAMNPDKTNDGDLISSYACDPATANAEFLYSKRQYRDITGRIQESDVIAYQLRQSFKPGEVTPEEANKIGYELAERFTKGNHAFLICTHVDKAHIHNHIIWNSTSLDCTRKFRNFWGSTEAIRKLSDLICTEHRLSVIENPQRHGKSYNKWLGDNAKLTNRDLLRVAIDAAIKKKPKNFDAFLRLLKSSGYTVTRRGKNLSFRHTGQKQNIRLSSLGDGYTEDDLRAVLSHGKEHNPFTKKKYPKHTKPSLILEIEAKLNSGKGYWYDQTMKVIKLKQMAKSLMYFEENGFADYDELAQAAQDAESRFCDLKKTVKSAENRMAEIQALKTHIINYSKTRDVYKGYREAGYSKKYLAEHEGEIILHKAAKKAFDESGLKNLPTVKSLQTEYAKLLSEKKAAYAEYRRAQDEMRELAVHRANAAYVLGIEQRREEQEKERQHEEK